MKTKEHKVKLEVKEDTLFICRIGGDKGRCKNRKKDYEPKVERIFVIEIEKSKLKLQKPKIN